MSISDYDRRFEDICSIICIYYLSFFEKNFSFVNFKNSLLFLMLVTKTIFKAKTIDFLYFSKYNIFEETKF